MSKPPPDVTFEFSNAAFASLSDQAEKNKFLQEQLKKFLKAFADISTPLNQPNLKAEISKFAEAFPDCFDTLLNVIFLDVCYAVVIMQTQLSQVPNVERYIPLAKMISSNILKQTTPIPVLAKALRILFQSQKFCNAFVTSDRNIQELFELGYSTKEYEKNMTPLLSCIDTIELSREISQNDPIRIITDLFNIIFEKDPDKDSSINVIGFIFDLIQVSSKSAPKLLDTLIENMVFVKINQFLAQCNTEAIWSLYSILLKISSLQFPDLPLNPIAFRQLGLLYLNESVSAQVKHGILQHVLKEDKIYTSNMCMSPEDFPLHKWLIPIVCTDVNCFNAYSQILEKMIRKSPQSLTMVFTKIVDMTKPPVNADFKYGLIFGWLNKATEKLGIDPEVFSDFFFFETFILRPDIESVASIFKLENFQTLLKTIFSSKRTKWYSDELIKKLIDVMNTEKTIYDFVSNLFFIDFSPSLLQYFIRNLEEESIKKLINISVPFSTLDIPNMFKVGNCFSAIEKLMTQSETYLYALLHFISLIMAYSNNHFFDEWVLKQNADSPIFTCDPTPFLANQTDGAPLTIPSLVPLLKDPYLTNSCYNRYLLGKYALPIYIKLNKPIPNLPQIASYYIRPNDVEYIFNNQLSPIHDLLVKKDEIQCYEFFPNHQIGYITVPDSKDGAQNFSFHIRFHAIAKKPFAFCLFNGTKLQYSGNKIFWKSSKAFDVKLNEWYHITLKRQKFITTKVCAYVNTHEICNTSGNLSFESIGDKESQPTVPYTVATNIQYYTNATDEQLSVKNTKKYHVVLHGGVRFAPIYPIQNTFVADNTRITNIFDIMDKLEDRSELIQVIFNIPQFLEDSQIIRFFGRFYFSLINLGKKANVDWVPNIIKCTQQIQNIELRSKSLYMLLMDVEFWDKMSTEFLIALMKCVNQIPPASIDYGLFCNHDLLLLYVILIIQNQNEDLKNEILVFIKTVCSRNKNILGSKYITQASRIVNMWNFTDDSFPKLIGQFKETTPLKEQLIEMALSIEKIQSETIFENETLLELALTVSHDLGLALYKKILIKLKEGSLNNYIPYISLLCKNFVEDFDIWNKTLSSIIKDGLDIHYTFYDVLKITNQNYIPIFLSMILTISTKDQKQLQDLVYQFTNKMFAYQNQYLVLLKKNLLPSFIDFISCAKRTIPQSSKLLQDPNTALLFKFLNFVMPDPLPESFVAFMIDFLTKMILANIKNAKNSVSVFQTIVLYCHQSFLEPVFINVLNSVKGVVFEPNELKAFISAYQLIVIKRNVSKEFIDAIFNYCDKDTFKLGQFFDVFVFSFDIIDLDRFLAEFADMSTIILRKSLQYCIFLFYQLIKIKCPPDCLFVLDFYQKLKQQNLPKQISAFVANSVDFGALIQNPQVLPQFEAYAEPEIAKEIKRIETSTDVQNSSNDVEKILETIYTFASKTAHLCQDEITFYFDQMNVKLRKHELDLSDFFYSTNVCFSQTHINEAKSYRIIPFSSPSTLPSIICPFPYIIKPPNFEGEAQIQEGDITILGLTPEENYGCSIPVEYPKHLYRWSTSFKDDKTKQFNLFLTMFNCQFNAECLLIRIQHRYKSLFFKRKDGTILILVNACMKDNTIEFLPNNELLTEAVLLGEFGRWSMFCGHFLLKFTPRDFLFVGNYISDSIRTSRLAFTVNGGTIVLRFENEPSFMSPRDYSQPKYIITKEKTVDDWINNRISNFEYLMRINLLANRCFTDMSAYPIFPRIVLSFKNETMEIENNLRPLNKPIQIVGDPDPSHANLMSRYKIQKFFYPENVLNSMIVSSINVRTPPFSQFQWEINDGWDSGDRNFLSIPNNMTIGPKTFYEIIPELYRLPEMLMNYNKFVLPSGHNLDIALPTWSESVFEFIEQHRYILELPETRSHLNEWIDLLYGEKQNSEQDLNIFNPLSYHLKQPQPDQVEWMKNCGQVPLQVFSTKSPTWKQQETRPNWRLVLKKKYVKAIKLMDGQQVIAQHNLTFFNIEPIIPISEVVDFSASNDEQFIQVTSALSNIIAYQIIYENNRISSFQELAHYNIPEPKFSVLNGKSMICATANDKEIVVWSFVSGLFCSKIEIENASSLVFDEETDSIYVGAGKVLYQYTINSNFVRKFELESEITCLSVFGHGFSINNRVIAIGHIDGFVRLCSYQSEKRQFEVFKEQQLCNDPIHCIEYANKNGEIDVYDLESYLLS